MESFDLSEDYANELIMKARKLIGIIEEDNIEEDNFDEEDKLESDDNEDPFSEGK